MVESFTEFHYLKQFVIDIFDFFDIVYILFVFKTKMFPFRVNGVKNSNNNSISNHSSFKTFQSLKIKSTFRIQE